MCGKPSFFLPAAVIVLTLCLSCSVKERRCDCPCWLILDLREVDGEKFDSVCVDVFSDDGFLHSESVPKDLYAKEYVLEVPRKNVIVNVRAEDGGCFGADRGVVIPYGEDCPPLWMYTDVLGTSGDTRRDTVRLHKSYSEIRVTMVSESGSVPFSIGVSGGISGYSPGGKPFRGDFFVGSELSSGGRCAVRVPRQEDPSLLLSVFDDGDAVRTFALGEYIASTGFDWTEEDLGDIDVLINFSLARLTLSVEAWEKTFTYDVEI